jgi:type VI secretion system protein ImpK
MASVTSEGGSTKSAYWVCAEVLLLALELPRAQLPATAELRQRILAVLDRMVAKARAEGMPDPDIQEARYAIVAFIDEQILKSQWPGRTEWMNEPLQLILYREFKAGEKFFARLKALLQAGNRPLALEVYYLCLSLGFRGSASADAPPSHLAEARGELARRFPKGSISPHARAGDRHTPERHGHGPVIAVIVAAACVALLVVLGLQWSLASTTQAVVETLQSRSSARVR